ncbi:hypothetical protein B296_00000134 [Ensete ventricosum]|uniref:Uncharacterized protein n=1 Tax=Ensete ventricosum TaxID=4639 RepID=A0A427B6W9_ENSVE|nr:hypothetical protein B296_00000134 [Ensete ventricosum]
MGDLPSGPDVSRDGANHRRLHPLIGASTGTPMRERSSTDAAIGSTSINADQEEHPDNEVPRCLPNEAMVENPNASIIQPSSRSRNVIHIPSESDAVSSDSTDSMRK